MSLQTRFARALLNPAAPVPPEVTSWNGSDPGQRFAVYRNNVTVALIEALASTFPVVKALVGEAFFAEMARVFLRAAPPRSAIMARYGAQFPGFIETFPPAGPLPYLADVARLEVARTRACHAADAQSLNAQAFAALPHAALADLRVALHPSTGLLTSPHAIVSLWAGHQGVVSLETVEPDAPEEALILRPAFEVLVLRLPPGGVAFLAALGAGAPLGEAALCAVSSNPAFSLPEAMQVLVSSGIATQIIPGALT